MPFLGIINCRDFWKIDYHLHHRNAPGRKRGFPDIDPVPCDAPPGIFSYDAYEELQGIDRSVSAGLDEDRFRDMCVSNTDDHLRNHAFLLTMSGWSLSPVFDINPEPTGDELSLNVDETDNQIRIELA